MIDFATYYSCIDFVHFWPKILSSSLYNTILYIVFRASALFVKRCIIKKNSTYCVAFSPESVRYTSLCSTSSGERMIDSFTFSERKFYLVTLFLIHLYIGFRFYSSKTHRITFYIYPWWMANNIYS